LPQFYSQNLDKTLDELDFEQNEIITIACQDWDEEFRFFVDFE